MARLSFDDFAATVLIDSQQSSITMITESWSGTPGQTRTYEFYYDGGYGDIVRTQGRATGFHRLWKTVNGTPYASQVVPALGIITPAIPRSGRPPTFTPEQNPDNAAVNRVAQLYNAGSGVAFWWGHFDLTLPIESAVSATTTYEAEIQLTG